MPTYEYECKSCGYDFDYFQSMKDEPLKVCPKCGKELRRLINGGTGVIFKGGGFYVTDKGSSGRCGGKSVKSEGSSSSVSKAGEAAKSDAPCSGCAKQEACPKTAS